MGCATVIANQTLEPTPVCVDSSAFAVDVRCPRGSAFVVSRHSRVMRFSIIYLCLGLLALTGCEVPQAQKLADCTTNSLDFSMPVRYSSPYEFVLGVPQSQTGKLGFQGEIILRQGTDVVARIPISSHDITPCNWLHSAPDLSGYILTWSAYQSRKAIERSACSEADL